MMSNFKNELLNLNDELTDINRDELLSDCIYNRLSKLLEVQAAYLDESLSAVQSELNLTDLSDSYNLRKFNVLFKNLHHYMGIDRYKIIKCLIRLKNL